MGCVCQRSVGERSERQNEGEEGTPKQTVVPGRKYEFAMDVCAHFVMLTRSFFFLLNRRQRDGLPSYCPARTPHQTNMRSDENTVREVKPLIKYTFPSDASAYLTTDSPAKLVKTYPCQYKSLVPRMSQLQQQLLDEQAGDAVELVGCDFDGGITMYPYNERVQPHYDYFASTIKTKGDLESIR